MLTPLVFFIVFGLLQLGQIGMGMMMVNYGAGSVARKTSRTSAVMANSANQFRLDFESLMVVGMKAPALTSCLDSANGGVTNNVVVIAEARLDAFPIIGPMLNAMAPDFKNSGDWKMPAGTCEPGPVPALGFTAEPPVYQFIVRGSAVARKNYL